GRRLSRPSRPPGLAEIGTASRSCWRLRSGWSLSQNVLDRDLAGLSAPHPYVCAARSPYCRVGWTEDHDYRRSHRSREMSDARIVTDVEPRSGQPEGEFVEIIEPRGIRKFFLGTGAPSDRHAQSRGQFAEPLQRPVLFRAA